MKTQVLYDKIGRRIEIFFRTNFVKNLKTDIMYSLIFFPKILTIYDIMRKKILYSRTGHI